MAIPFAPALLIAAALLALWIDTRHPGLAPESLSRRVLAAAFAVLALEALPVFHGSVAAVYATVFAILLPVLVSLFLTAVWLLRAMRDVQFGH